MTCSASPYNCAFHFPLLGLSCSHPHFEGFGLERKMVVKNANRHVAQGKQALFVAAQVVQKLI